MSDDHSQSNDSPSPKKGFFTLILNQLFHGEPKNRGDLVELIRDSEQNDLIDPDTRDMLEGVMDIAEQRVRDIMIPRSQMVTLKRNQTLEECLDVIIESAHSRFPVISEDKDHIEGILMQAFGHLPARGETIEIEGYLFKVAMADSRRIIQVHVKIPDDSPQPKLEE
ncbi:Magnesium and cobalt efflux protein CorC [Serratia liquefaciens]|uniref:transporter associated domain-containing protein n=1 Tax=Serratia liquefaciens TaxID=614 RepID=UPI002183B0FC|nr:transporter associated domain-containing protein [Serratia liquefaciens]CAI2470763.1 Magnesium and cobalt efflux protein CorC [Serratia liquefaciens]